ncbi:hypothetical protein COEREDRAFT_81117 [Coemansia reversa NRRL 1564]|uniref:Uncharacterized protein n=1 Tax=Coemansia reversa (strain ATCC 12441 / NRRL 1564) TaxID=763665 RepID=A0A2G5BCN5_COERN|nr:hypothetical protein COEREDRAFT_81117 [Coemansia reversa NRRL 1564]|eukprot:PIA16775.1 hypothetical protein COEREDRAFT_81117 [Coemansia reversa NRRL 1564]
MNSFSIPKRRCGHPAVRVFIAVAVLGLLTIYLVIYLHQTTHAIAGDKYSSVDNKPGLDNLWQPLIGQKRAGKCQDLPIPASYWTAQEAYAPAFVNIPNYQKAIQIGQSVCVRVVVPARKDHVSLTYTPLTDAPWDSVLLDMVGKSTGISVPVKLRMVADYRNTQRSNTHIYEADVVLRDEDMYVPQGFIEFRDAEWNPEDALEPVDYKPEHLFIPKSLAVTVEDRDQTSQYSLAKYLDLPLCTRANMDGRWIKVSNLPFDSSLVPPPDNHNLVWLPYECRLQPISYQDFAVCLNSHFPLMHWFGDSNLRRALKKVTTMGEWCKENVETRRCLCEDYGEPFSRFDPRIRQLLIDMDGESGGRSILNHTINQPSISELEEKGGSRIYLHKWEGLIQGNRRNWFDEFEKGITSRFGKPQLAIISLINWDTAFSSRQNFAIQLGRLLDYIEREYKPDTRIVIRTGQYYCCRSDSSTKGRRAYSRLRNAYFDDYVIRAFHERFDETHNVDVWDVSSLSEHLPFFARNESVACPSNHARSEVVEIENQVLFNAMCNNRVEESTL